VVRVTSPQSFTAILKLIHRMAAEGGVDGRELSALAYRLLLEISDSAPREMPEPVYRIVQTVVAEPARLASSG